MFPWCWTWVFFLVALEHSTHHHHLHSPTHCLVVDFIPLFFLLCVSSSSCPCSFPFACLPWRIPSHQAWALEVAQVLLWDHPKELLVLLHLECLHSGPLHLPMVPFLLDLPFPHRVKCYHKKTCSDINWKDIASGLEGVNRSILKFNQLYETS
jgi:hypothetical protein